jgi:RNA-binding protein
MTDVSIKSVHFSKLGNIMLSKEQHLKLKQQSHHLKPVVLIGQKGLTEAVINETNLALQAHECIKIKINGCDKEERKLLTQDLCLNLNAILIDTIGHMVTIYRKKDV